MSSIHGIVSKKTLSSTNGGRKDSSTGLSSHQKSKYKLKLMKTGGSKKKKERKSRERRS
jgi:hypothetical protein